MTDQTQTDAQGAASAAGDEASSAPAASDQASSTPAAGDQASSTPADAGSETSAADPDQAFVGAVLRMADAQAAALNRVALELRAMGRSGSTHFGALLAHLEDLDKEIGAAATHAFSLFRGDVGDALSGIEWQFLGKPNAASIAPAAVDRHPNASPASVKMIVKAPDGRTAHLLRVDDSADAMLVQIQFGDGAVGWYPLDRITDQTGNPIASATVLAAEQPAA